MSQSIAIVGLSCIYPDARAPMELWENILAQRRAFRRLPDERLRAEDYLSDDPQSPDCTYAVEAAVIEGYQFDRVAFRVVGSTYRSADLAHWLALDVASRALDDAGFRDAVGLPREMTGVVLGNTLTGEFSRANSLRLRWPYVKRVLQAALTGRGWSPDQRHEFLEQIEAQYKAPFPPVGEESLAGGLSNTIAGRICNQFDLKGGGYTVDGACASSLLAVANACSALAAGDLDVALAGGVDLSLDPFEIVGFAKTGALAPELMRIYDTRSAGFWPGEGCGFAVLMRHADAVAEGRRIYAVIRGWGISSDGSGGITRPEMDGQLQALRRAYRRAGYGIDTVAYFEGHGTGTSLGDATELKVISSMRREAKPGAPPAAIGSIKANIGHTKAAAGIAGLIKATLAIHTQTVPPTTGCERPHSELTGPSPALRILREPEPWPVDRPLRASVSAMGFGGINTHLTLEGEARPSEDAAPRKLGSRERSLSASAQDAELFLLAGLDADELRRLVEHLLTFAARLSRSELTDLAAELERTLPRPAGVRAAVVASSPAELAQSLRTLRSWLDEAYVFSARTALPLPVRNEREGRGEGHPTADTPAHLQARRPSSPQPSPPSAGGEGEETGALNPYDEAIVERLDLEAGVFLGSATTAPRLGFLFPGQGAPANLTGGIYCRRFDVAREVYDQANLFADNDGLSTQEREAPTSRQANRSANRDRISTAVAQPALVLASLAGLRVLNHLGLNATAAVGHSLGEITALHWAGAMDGPALLRIASVRGEAMAEFGSPTGAMAAIAASWREVEPLLKGDPVTIVGFNSPRQTVVAGEMSAVAAVSSRARSRGLGAVTLPVSHAFHTPLVAGAAPVLAQQLALESLAPLQRRVFSTVSGVLIKEADDLHALLLRQVTSPVRFMDAVSLARDEIDLWIEVGPGQVLAKLAHDFIDRPVVPLDAGGASLQGLWRAVGAAFALGAPVDHAALFRGRFTRAFNLDWQPKFFANPCELAPLPEDSTDTPARSTLTPPLPHSPTSHPRPATSPLDLIRQLVAERAELPAAAVKDDSRLLSDLHLNSITVGQLVAEAASRLGLPPLIGLTDFANATVAGTAQALEQLARTGSANPAVTRNTLPQGVDAWIRTFTVEKIECPLPPRPDSFQYVFGARTTLPLPVRHERGEGRGEGHPTADTPTHLPARRPSPPSAGGEGEEIGALNTYSSQLPPHASRWQIVAPPNHPLSARLHQALCDLPASGVIVCLPEAPDETCVKLLLDGARTVLAAGAGEERQTFALVQHGVGAGGFARSLHLERPEVTTCVVDLPFDHARAAEWVRDEILSATGYSEAHYDPAGVRREPRLKFLPLSVEPDELPISANDLVLVTGGGRGIAAECALALARKTGARLALLGRSRPSVDVELAANLERISAAGVQCRYFAADVSEADAVRAVVRQIEREWGTITGLLHGAGTNRPQLLGALDEAGFQRTLAPKIRGARNLLAAIDPSQLRLFITFGSIIARTGLQGEADYAVANEWLTNLTEEFQTAYPRCRCVAMEWSVWSGLGMGQKLGRIEALRQSGVTPIPPEEGVEMFLRLLAQKLPSASVVVTGRYGELPTLKLEKPELPFLRFLEQPKVFYPGVELIADTELSADSDPYVEDHVYHGERLFPAVMGLEAMAQVAMALAGSTEPPGFEDAQWSRPVVVPQRGKVTIRVAALVRKPGVIEVALRSQETGFLVDHFRVTCRFDGLVPGGGRDQALASLVIDAGLGEQSRLTPAAALEEWKSKRVPLDPGIDLYRDLLFHTGRFQRVLNFRLLRAKECVAHVEPDTKSAWFGRYLPQDRVLGDTGVRDAAIHAIQACIPHARLLPIGVGRIVIGKIPCLLERLAARGAIPELLLHARERRREGDTFHYDLELLGEDGTVLEQWEDLRLRKVDDIARRSPWTAALLGPHVERRVEELIPGSQIAVALEVSGAGEHAARSDAAIQAVIGKAMPVQRRPDGKPELPDGTPVSVAHAGELTLAVTGPGPVGCDLEVVTSRSIGVWQGLLGVERFRLAEWISREADEDIDAAATRVWVAGECLKKAGAASGAPLTMASVKKDGWVLLASGSLSIAIGLAPVARPQSRMAIGVLTQGGVPS
ncbi:MAG TPA: SDR family NAD(P)-dependent oxidoreductase [Verrucomicrobiae bacterium]|jgi:enediyne polyketide synthase